MENEPSAVNGRERYDVLVVEQYEDEAGSERSHWTRVGVAFPHRDGQGLNVELKAFPVSASSSFAAMRGGRGRASHEAVKIVTTSRVPMTDVTLMEYDSLFCANTACMLHVGPQDPNVRGWGNWAQLPDGTLIGRQRVEATMLCDACARRILTGEVTLATRPNASAA